MEKVRSERRYAPLTFKDGEVVVTPKDYDIFALSAERAIEAYRDFVERERRIERFESDFLVPLFQWCLAHSDRVRACYLPLPVRQIQVFVLTASPRFDFQLAEEIAALELGLSRAGWRVGVLQLPKTDEESLATFFDPTGALEVYAHSGSTPEEG